RVRRGRTPRSGRVRHAVPRDDGDVGREAGQQALPEPRALPGRRGQCPRPLQRRPQRLPPAPPWVDRAGDRGAPHRVASAASEGDRRAVRSLVATSGTASGAGGRGLRLLVRLACARPLVTVLLGVLGAVAALTYTVRQLGFVTSGRDLLPQDQPFVQREEEYSDDVARSKAYARRLAQELRKERDTFAHVTYRIDPSRFRGRELLYLSR